MGLLAALWNLYLGLLTLLGNTVLVIIGIGLCGYATAQQLEPIHDATLDVILFACGILLISFSMIRRLVWSFVGLALVWGGAVWFVAQELAANDHSFAFTPTLLAIAFGPPLLVSLLMEATRKIEPNEIDLEISLSEEKDPSA